MAPSLGFRHILNHLPLRQGSLPKDKGTSGNNFLRRICQRGSKINSSSKTSLFQNKNRPRNFLHQFFSRIFFRRRKMKNCKSSETRFAKVSRRSELCSGVNGRSNFQKSLISRVGVCELAFEKMCNIRTFKRGAEFLQVLDLHCTLY